MPSISLPCSRVAESAGRTRRIARDDELGCVGDVFAGNLIGKRDGSGLLAQEFIRHAHDGILFMHDHRHVQLLGRHAHRNGHISPKADNGVRRRSKLRASHAFALRAERKIFSEEVTSVWGRSRSNPEASKATNGMSV